jgi:glycogen debranching enzyme
MPLTVQDGSTFCVCDERGDLDGAISASGLFASDTRFLSRLVLTVNGLSPEPESLEQPAPFLAYFVLAAGRLSIIRERFIGNLMEERISVYNRGKRAVEVDVAIALEADFADIFTVKDLDPGFGRPAPGLSLPAPRPPRWDAARHTALFTDDAFPARTLVQFSHRCESDARGARFGLSLEPRRQWEIVVTVQPLLDDTVPLRAQAIRGGLIAERHRAVDSLLRWRADAPRLTSPWNDLERTWERSVADLAALRMSIDGLVDCVPAAGTPWFMTVFGRDTLITCLQSIVFGPDLAQSTLRVLTATQATEDDPELDAEPGKIIHELRRGKAALVRPGRYYGTVDATPLFLVLLSELWRWTGDATLVAEFENPARRALAWIDSAGDRDGDGFVEYERRASRGFRNQCWKDSDTAMSFHDGSLAEPPIAAAEVQGYVYDAKLRIAELAREVWDDSRTATRLESEARTLRSRFNEAFWVERESGFYALGLDRDKHAIDSPGSNMGHLLWSGIVPPERVDAVANRLMDERLWSGWGVRTMARGEGAFDPLAYHNGTVWPHDNSLIAWGLARAGRREDAHRIVRSLIEAAAGFDFRLPEVFAGFERGRSQPPAVYPTSCSPQAWAAATPILLLRVLLELEPDQHARAVRASAGRLPEWAEGLTLERIQAFGGSWKAQVENGTVSVER